MEESSINIQEIKSEEKVNPQDKIEETQQEEKNSNNLDPDKKEVEEIILNKIQVKGRKRELKKKLDTSSNENQIEVPIDSNSIQTKNIIESVKETINNETKTKSQRKKTKKQIADTNVKLTEVFKTDTEFSSPDGNNVKTEEKEKPQEPLIENETEKKNESNNNITEISTVIKKINAKVNKKKSKAIESEEEKQENQIKFIDLDELNSNKLVSNTEMILAIMEICYNCKKYGIDLPNNTREFWKVVYEKSEWQNILSKFQSETMRKYWRTIRDISQPTKIIDLLEKYKDNFNAVNVKLLPVINSISYFLQTNDESFEPYLKGLVTTNSGQRKEKSEAEINLIRKRKRDDDIEEDVKQISKIMGSDFTVKKNKIIYDVDEDDEFTIKNFKNENTPNASRKRSQRKTKTLTVDLTGDDIKDCEQVEEIINTFRTHFKNKNSDEILDSLFKTSFNLQNSYLILIEPNLFKNFAFDEPEDRTIKFLENSNTYEKLVNLKGIQLVEERKKFLLI